MGRVDHVSEKFVVADDAPQQRPDVHPGTAEALITGVRGDARLLEVLRVGRTEHVIRVGLDDVTAHPSVQDLFGGGIDHSLVASGLTGTGRYCGQQVVTFVDEPLEPGLDLQRDADLVLEARG